MYNNGYGFINCRQESQKHKIDMMFRKEIKLMTKANKFAMKLNDYGWRTT